MILFIVIIGLIQTILNLLNTSKSTALSCGLAGFYPKKGKKVNLHNLFLLGIMNEERGTDSTGLSIGGIKFNGVKEDKKCRDFLVNNIEDIEKVNLFNKPCILHTRKSTVGLHNEANCHPFVITSKVENDYYFALAHNGVINNTKAIKDKFLSNIENVDNYLHIDSHYIALSLNNSFKGVCDEKEVLEFYKGNAALLYYDNNSTFKVWKGGSNNVEERPMYYIETLDGWYFCSIENSLKIVFKGKYAIKSLDNNQLLTFHNNKFESSIIINRTHEVATTSYYNKNYNYDYDYEWQGYYTKKSGMSKDVKPINSSKETKQVYSNPNNSPLYHPIINIIDCSYIDRHTRNHIDGSYKLAGSLYSKDKLYSLFSNKSSFVDDVVFVKGVAVKNKNIFESVRDRFSVKYYKTVQNFFDGEYNKIVNTIVDFIPLYDAKGLYVIIYADENGKLNYVSRHDNKSLVIKTKFSSNNLHIYCNSEKIVAQYVNTYV
jgi:hypothetical protein